MNPDVSIIIPVYNVAPFLQRCLDSIDAQRCDRLSFQIILIDDGSTDSSGDICDRYASIHHDTTVVHQTNAGLGAARNAGMELARGRWICFVDSDDALVPDSLPALVRHTEQADADIGQGTWIAIRGRRREKLGNLFKQSVRVLDRYTVLRLTCNENLRSYTPGRIYRRELIGNIPFDTGVCYEDMMWTIRVLDNCRRYAVINLPHYLYYYRQESISGHISHNTLDANLATAQRLEYCREHHPECIPDATRILWHHAFNNMADAKATKSPFAPELEQSYNNLMLRYADEVSKYVKPLTAYRAAMHGRFTYRIYNILAPYLAPVKHVLKRISGKTK